MLIVVNNGTHFLPELRAALDRLGVAHEIAPGSETVQPEHLDAYSGVILTGGAVHVFDPGDLATVTLDEQILSTSEIPVLGICLGHQLVALHYGAEVGAMPMPINQMETVEIVRQDPLFTDLPATVTMRVAHNDAVMTLTPPLVQLARSDTGEYEAIRHRDHPHYGLQFHPEASGDDGLTILRNFAALCGVSSRSLSGRR